MQLRNVCDKPGSWGTLMGRNRGALRRGTYSLGTSLGLVNKTLHSQCGAWFGTGQGTRSHVAQLRVFMVQLQIPHDEA